MLVRWDEGKLVIEFDRFTSALMAKLFGEDENKIADELEDLFGSVINDISEDIIKGRD